MPDIDSLIGGIGRVFRVFIPWRGSMVRDFTGYAGHIKIVGFQAFNDLGVKLTPNFPLCKYIYMFYNIFSVCKCRIGQSCYKKTKNKCTFYTYFWSPLFTALIVYTINRSHELHMIHLMSGEGTTPYYRESALLI